MTTVAALKALYVALGGSADTVADMVIIPDVVNAIATLVAAGIEGTLPAVTETDKGKVLMVSNDGEWEVADLPAGSTPDSTPTG